MRALHLTSSALILLAAACAEPSAVTAPAASGEPASSEPAPPPATATADADGASATAVLRRVEPDEVCMMNNRFMKEKQIPVPIDGRTYYGCCAMCKDKLTSDPAARTAIDPVSGRPVDKAIAVIGAKPSNAVVYFENQENLDAYVRAGGPPPRDTSAPSPSAAATPAASSSAPAAAAAPPAAPPRAQSTAPRAAPPAAPPAPPATAPRAAPAVPPAAGHDDHSGHAGH